MLFDENNRGIPPPWEPPRKAPDKRVTNAATTLLILISVIALGAPIAGATLLGAVSALVTR